VKLRHDGGYKLANDGHDTRAIQHYLGHRNIQHTVRYTDRVSSCARNAIRSWAFASSSSRCLMEARSRRFSALCS
jgi:site-specific recombinase XerD